ncbi:hypothetical protein [Paenibacillus sp. 22594]|uniref:hypothetical protein n=1 Tax=Paenibacillus sp. 22594 TaxID=3453947 RepID=UPI003F857428
MATIISYGSQEKIPLDPLTTVLTVAEIPGAGAELAAAQVDISPANPASFSSRVYIYRSFFRFTTITTINLYFKMIDSYQ